MNFDELMEEMLLYYPDITQGAVDITQEDDYCMKLVYENGDIRYYDATNHSTKLVRPNLNLKNHLITTETMKRDFARRLNRQIYLKNTTKRVVSEKTGIPYSAVSKYSTAKVEPSAFNVLLISEALGCSVSDLLKF